MVLGRRSVWIALGASALAIACGMYGAAENESGEMSDGGIADARDSTDAPAESSAAVDAAVDGTTDGGADACAACTGAGASCNAGVCTIQCTADAGSCRARAVCGPGLDCRLACTESNSCVDVSCAPGSKSCFFDCTNGEPACSNVHCAAPSCLVSCTNPAKCEGTMMLGGGDAGLACVGPNACGGVTNAACDAGVCTLTCSGANSCPQNRICSASSTCVGSW